MPTKLEFAQLLKDRGANREQARDAFRLYEERGGIWDKSEPYTVIQQDVRNIDAPVEKTDAEKAKTFAYLESAGYGVPRPAVEKMVEQIAGQNNYSGFNRRIAQQLSVEQTGPVRNSAKTRKHNVNQLIYEEKHKSPLPSGEFNGESVSAKDRQLMLEQSMLGPELLVGGPMKGFISGVTSVKESPAVIMRTLGGGFLMFGNLTNINNFTLEGRRMVRIGDELSKAPDAMLRPMIEAISNGNSTTIDEFVNGIFPTSQTVSQNKKLKFFGGLTEMAGQIYGYSRLGALAPAGIYSDVNKGVYSTLTEYMDEDKAAVIAIPITLTAGFLQTKAIETTFASSPVANTGAKSMIVKSLKRIADRGVPALYEGVGETFEEGAPIYAGGGFDALKKNASNLINVFATSFLVTFALKTGVDIKSYGAKAEISKTLKAEGYSDETSKTIADILVSNNTESEKDAKIQKHLELQKSRRDLVLAINGYAETFNQASKEIDTEETIEGLDGKPITDVDLEILRNQPELMEDLDESEEASILRKAVYDNDQGALSEYNRRLVGVEEQSDQDTLVSEDNDGVETPVDIAEKSVEKTLLDLEREMASDKTEEEDYSDYSIPQEGETDDNGVPRLIGMSRRFNQQWNDALELGCVPNTQRVEWATTLNNAYKMGLHKHSQELINNVRNGGQLNSDEIAGLLIAKADIANKIEANAIEIRKADEAGDADRATELRLMQGQMINNTIQLAKAASRAGTENARALAAMAMVMDRKSFTLENIMALATQMKGGELDADTAQELTDLHEDLQAVEQELDVTEEGEPDDQREFILDQLRRVHRRIKSQNRKKDDKNADIKFLLKRQDKVINLINELEGRNPTKAEKKTLEHPDSEGYLEMIQELEKKLKLRKDREKAFDRNVKLIDKRDAVLAEIENLHRDIKEKADQLEKSKLREDTEKYKQARRDQDTIASLLAELRGDVDTKMSVTKEDVYGYQQTIQELRKNISDKRMAERLQKEIDALDSAVEEGDVDYNEFVDKEKTRVDEKVIELRKRKEELRKRLESIRRDRDKLDRQRAEALEIIEEVQTASRRVKENKANGEDVNADLKLIRSRQDKIFSMIDEINRGKPQKEKIKKVRKPDSEGYLDMIEALESELKQKRQIRGLEADIKRMEYALDSADLSEFKKQPKKFKDEPKEIRDLRARKLALQQEINRRIQNEAPNTKGKVIAHGYDMFRTAKLTFDFGHIFRQGGVNMTDIRLWLDGSNLKMIGQTFTSMESNGAITAQLDVMSSPYYELGQQAGLRIPKEGEHLTDREQLKMGGIFGRSQVAGTAAIRQSLFDSIVGQYGNDITLEEAKDVSFAVNILTGYGQYKSPGEGIDKALNVLFISPRFRMSRFQAPALLLLSRDGRRIANNKILRNRIIEIQAQFALSRIIIAGLAASLWPDDVKVILDRKHWAFGRIAVETESGQWRVYNPWAGITSAYSWVRKWGETGAPIASLLDTTKTATHPFFAFMRGMATGELYGGDKAPRVEIAIRSVMPISIEGMVDSWFNDTGNTDIFFSTLADVFGVDNTLVDYEDLQSKDAPDGEWSMEDLRNEIDNRDEYEGWLR